MIMVGWNHQHCLHEVRLRQCVFCRSSCNFGPLTDLAISVLREVSINNCVYPKSTLLADVASKDGSWEELAWEPPCSGISSSSTKFSLNSCSHSGSQNTTGLAQDHGRLFEVHISKHSPFFSIALARLKITVGCPTRTCPSIHDKNLDHGRLTRAGTHIQAFTQKLALTLSRSRSVARRARVQSMCAEITLCGHHLRPWPFPKNLSFFFHSPGKPGQDTHDDGLVGYVFFTRLNVVRRHHVPVLHVEPSSCTTAPTSCRRPGTRTGWPFRPLPPRPEPQHAAMSDQNRAFGQKADWTCDPPAQKKRGNF